MYIITLVRQSAQKKTDTAQYSNSTTRHNIGHFGDEGGGLSSDMHLSFSNGGPAT